MEEKKLLETIENIVMKIKSFKERKTVIEKEEVEELKKLIESLKGKRYYEYKSNVRYVYFNKRNEIVIKYCYKKEKYNIKIIKNNVVLLIEAEIIKTEGKCGGYINEEFHVIVEIKKFSFFEVVDYRFKEKEDWIFSVEVIKIL